MLKLVKLEKEHIQNIDTDFAFNKSYRDDMCKHNVNGYTALKEDKPIAIAGINLLWDGVAEGWIVLGKESESYKFQIAKTVKIMLQRMISDNNLFRLQASVCVDDKKAIRFTQWLKFTEEGIMRRFGPDGSDYMRYAWVN
tara:strand:+ start:7466 stop:7885 length:420 start_codon:yes stop_codon:yes gene_type:complete